MVEVVEGAKGADLNGSKRSIVVSLPKHEITVLQDGDSKGTVDHPGAESCYDEGL